jgi:hypothetical protein
MAGLKWLKNASSLSFYEIIPITDQRWIQGGEEIGDEGVHTVR